MEDRVTTCQAPDMRSVVCCDICRTRFVLSDPLVVATAELATFAAAHGEHEDWAMSIRPEAACECLRSG
jgi:hypothetical protein